MKRNIIIGYSEMTDSSVNTCSSNCKSVELPTDFNDRIFDNEDTANGNGNGHIEYKTHSTQEVAFNVQHAQKLCFMAARNEFNPYYSNSSTTTTTRTTNNDDDSKITVNEKTKKRKIQKQENDDFNTEATVEKQEKIQNSWFRLARSLNFFRQHESKGGVVKVKYLQSVSKPLNYLTYTMRQVYNAFTPISFEQNNNNDNNILGEKDDEN